MIAPQKETGFVVLRSFRRGSVASVSAHQLEDRMSDSCFHFIFLSSSPPRTRYSSVPLNTDTERPLSVSVVTVRYR